MLEKLKARWRPLVEDKPGHRFQNRYERRHKGRSSPRAMRVGWSVLAVLLILVGIVGLPLPGPGILVIAAGLALLAEESRTISRFLDRSEIWLRGAIKGLFPRRRTEASRRH